MSDLFGGKPKNNNAADEARRQAEANRKKLAEEEAKRQKQIERDRADRAAQERRRAGILSTILSANDGSKASVLGG